MSVPIKLKLSLIGQILNELDRILIKSKGDNCMTLKTDYLLLKEFMKEAEALPRDLSKLPKEEALAKLNEFDILQSNAMKLIWYNKVINKENYEDLRDSKELGYNIGLRLLIDILHKSEEKILLSDPSLGNPAIRVESNPKCLICITSTLPDDFYIKLINEINILYDNNRYVPACILLRKLFENLIIDILRKKYGTKDIDLYYNTSRKMFQNFSTLLDNLNGKIGEFGHIDPNFDKDIIKMIDCYRKRCNEPAHSISFEITKEKIDNEKEDINYLIKLLIRVLNNIS